MKFTVAGRIRRSTQFSIEVEAESEKHARAMALMKLGSRQGISKNNIVIESIDKAEGK
jgi:ribosomal protein L20A (L18A)